MNTSDMHIGVSPFGCHECRMAADRVRWLTVDTLWRPSLGGLREVMRYVGRLRHSVRAHATRAAHPSTPTTTET